MTSNRHPRDDCFESAIGRGQLFPFSLADAPWREVAAKGGARIFSSVGALAIFLTLVHR